MDTLTQTFTEALRALHQTVDEGKRLNEEYERISSECLQLQEQVQSLSGDVDANFQKVAEGVDLIVSAQELHAELDQVSEELPAILMATNNEKESQKRALESLQQQLKDLTSEMRQEQDTAAAAERDRCQRELDQKRERASDARYAVHKMMNETTELRDTLSRAHTRMWDNMTAELNKQTAEWDREFYELQGQKSLKKKMLRDDMKQFRMELADELRGCHKLIDAEDAAIAELQAVLSGPAVPAQRSSVSAEPEWPALRPERRDRQQERDEQLFRSRHVTFADLPDYAPRDNLTGHTGQGDGRRRLSDFTVSLSDDDDDDF